MHTTEIKSFIENLIRPVIIEAVLDALEGVKLPTTPPLPEPDRWFDLNELCIYHPDKPSKPTVYGWVNAKSIPFYKRGKKLYFLKSEIDLFLKEGRKKTLAETAKEAELYLKRKK